MPGLDVADLLVDVSAHLLDVAGPLGRVVDLPPDGLARALDRAAGYRGRTAKVFRPLPWRDVRLVATDHPWSAGDGPEAYGSLRDLFLVVIGRPVGIAGVAGPGVATLGHLPDR